MRGIPRTVRFAAVALVGVAGLGACTPAPGADPTGSTEPPTSVTPTTATPTTATPTTVPTPPVSTAIGGDYRVRYATDSTATIRVAGDTLTVTAGPGFRVENSSCTLPTNAVLAVLSGSGNSRKV